MKKIFRWIPFKYGRKTYRHLIGIIPHEYNTLCGEDTGTLKLFFRKSDNRIDRQSDKICSNCKKIFERLVVNDKTTKFEIME